MSLKSNLKPTSRLIFVVAACVLLVRLVAVAFQAETGWETVADPLKQNVLEWTGQQGRPIYEQEPVEQARFWLSETERVVNRYPNSAAFHMGAAWLLDSPSVEFLISYLRESLFADIVPIADIVPRLDENFILFNQLDEEGISKAKADFRALCTKRCLELAARATELDPEDKRWWRMRALLLFEGDMLWSGQEFAPRSEDWLQVLDKCIAHDPENALYDYLAAKVLWDQSADFEFPVDNDDLMILNVTDEKGFAAGGEHFQAGQGRKYLAIGEAGYPAIAKFLSYTGASLDEQCSFASSRLVTMRHSLVFMSLNRWQSIRSDAARREGNPERALQFLRKQLHLYEQSILPRETSALETLTTLRLLREAAYRTMQHVSHQNPDILAKETLRKLQEREKELRIESDTLTAALEKLENERTHKEEQLSLVSILFMASNKAMILLLVTAAVLWLLARMLLPNSQKLAGPGPVAQGISWLVGCGAAFVLFGMAPAEMISHSIQSSIATWSVRILVACVVMTIVWMAFLRFRKWQFKVRVSILIATAVVGTILLLNPLFVSALYSVLNSSKDVWMPAIDWYGVSADALLTSTPIEKGTWEWAVLQWFAYGGVVIGLFSSLLLLGVWTMWSTARQAGVNPIAYWSREFRTRWSSLFRVLAGVSIVAAFCAFLIYVAVAPQVVRAVEEDFQYKMQYCRNPQSHYEKIREAQAEVQASPERMKQIRVEVEKEMQKQGSLVQDAEGS